MLQLKFNPADDIVSSLPTAVDVGRFLLVKQAGANDAAAAPDYDIYVGTLVGTTATWLLLGLSIAGQTNIKVVAADPANLAASKLRDGEALISYNGGSAKLFYNNGGALQSGALVTLT